VPISAVKGGNDFYFNYAQLPEQAPDGASNLLEQMTWALLTHPDYDQVIWPLSNSIDNSRPLCLVPLKNHGRRSVMASGFIGLSRNEPHDSGRSPIPKTLCFSHALIAGKTQHTSARLSLSRHLKNKLSPEQKSFLKRKADALRELMTPPKITRTQATEYPLALAKSWHAEFIRPDLALNPKLTVHEPRIPVLIATHWLELGGAEKFAVDLVKALPKERYAVYVTTDIASFNHWQTDIIEHVEAVFHLPGFLPDHAVPVFYEYLIRSRHIRLLHLHHAARAYDALRHIRRFHPRLQILDSLHIVELPPNDGGYAEASARRFEAFINHHHVISQFLKNFLTQRWQIQDNKISVIYLNVDSHYFDPERVAKGQIRHALNIPDQACLVGFLGRFSAQKQPLKFIEAAQLLQQRWQQSGATRPLVFLMVGSGLLESEIKRAIRRARGTTILLHPQLQDTRPVYRDCDVLMMPSANEGLALVSYEAMAMQTPIFFTDVGAQSELLPAEFLIDNSAPLAKKFADAMWPYLIDAEKRRHAGVTMRRHICEHHTHEQTISQLLALYEHLLSQA